MNISMVGRHFDFTDPIKKHIETLIYTLDKYKLDIIQTRAIIAADEKKGKKGFSVEFAINIANMNTIVIKQIHKDVYAAADLAIDRAHKALRRYHDKMISNRLHLSNAEKDLKNNIEKKSDEHNSSEDEIVICDLDLHKPLEIEDALEILKDSNQHFFVFNDIDGKTRVIYKRSDNKFGLY